MTIKHAPPEKESLNLKVSTELYRAIKTLAVKQDRSVSYVAKSILEAGLSKLAKQKEKVHA